MVVYDFYLRVAKDFVNERVSAANKRVNRSLAPSNHNNWMKVDSSVVHAMGPM